MKLTGKMIYCKTCGKEKYKPQWLIDRGNSTFCSKKCANVYTASLPNSYQKNKTQVSKDKTRQSLIGHKLSAKVKDALKQHAFRPGKDHPNWRGGIATLPWGPEFTVEKKARIRQRDGNTCQWCGKKELDINKMYHKHLTVHHIDYNKFNNEDENLITLCRQCNNKMNFDRINYPVKLKLIVDEIVRTSR